MTSHTEEIVESLHNEYESVLQMIENKKKELMSQRHI